MTSARWQTGSLLPGEKKITASALAWKINCCIKLFQIAVTRVQVRLRMNSEQIQTSARLSGGFFFFFFPLQSFLKDVQRRWTRPHRSRFRPGFGAASR